MAKKPESAKEWPGKLGEPITISFRNIRPAYPKDAEGFVRQAIWLGLLEQLKKLSLLVDHYGFKQEDPDRWLWLAFHLARDLHPGFRIVYDDWLARSFKALWGFTPVFPMKDENPSHRATGTGWAPTLMPEVVALLVDTLKPVIKRNDEEIVEMLAVFFDRDLKKPSKKSEKERRVATLKRRLSKGRKMQSDSRRPNEA
jgi:hypothetical protein